MTEKRTIIVPGDTSNEAERIKQASAFLKTLVEAHRPAGTGYILITFESPLSLKRAQVSLASDHDVATIERILHGIVHRSEQDKPRIIA